MENDFVLTKIHFAGLSRVLVLTFFTILILRKYNKRKWFKEFKFVLTNFAIFDGHGRFLLILLNFLYNFSFTVKNTKWKVIGNNVFELTISLSLLLFLTQSQFKLLFTILLNIFSLFFQCSLRSNNFLNCGNIQNGNR